MHRRSLVRPARLHVPPLFRDPLGLQGGESGPPFCLQLAIPAARQPRRAAMVRRERHQPAAARCLCLHVARAHQAAQHLAVWLQAFGEHALVWHGPVG